MLDIELLVTQLRSQGHQVESIVPLAENAGEFQFMIDGHLLTLADVRGQLEQEQVRRAT